MRSKSPRGGIPCKSVGYSARQQVLHGRVAAPKAVRKILRLKGSHLLMHDHHVAGLDALSRFTRLILDQHVYSSVRARIRIGARNYITCYVFANNGVPTQMNDAV